METGSGRRSTTGPVQLGKGTRGYSKWFATQNVSMPAKGDPGNASSRQFPATPGTSNWDMNLAKTFPLGSEKRNFALPLGGLQRIQPLAIQQC